MKRSELVVGEEYLVNRGNDWLTARLDGNGYYSTRRMVLLDAGRWSSTRGYFVSRDQNTVVLPDGKTVVGYFRTAMSGDNQAGVLMARWEEGERDHYEVEVVPLRSIRATWAEGSAAVTEARDKEAAARARKQREQARLVARLNAAKVDLGDLATHVSTYVSGFSASIHVTSVEGLEAIAAAVKAGRR